MAEFYLWYGIAIIALCSAAVITVNPKGSI